MTARAVLVTGATGFLGSALVARLARDGTRVHALARAGSDAAFARGLDVVWHVADLLEPPSVERAIAAFAADARERGLAPDVVHAAAQLGYRSGGAELARRVNVEGTRVVLEASRAAGVRRVAHVSSIVAVGCARDARAALAEDARFNGARLRVDYVTTKRAAEDFALAVSRELDVVIASPGAIFGDGPPRTNSHLFLRRVAEGRIGVAPPGSTAVVGVQDAADGILRALERGARGRRYVLIERNVTHRELIALAARALGVPEPRLTAPRAAWSVLAAAAEALDRVRPLSEATPQALRMLGAHFRVDARRAREELGWRPRAFEDVIAEMVSGMRARGALP